jgi:hypothetical protein
MPVNKYVNAQESQHPGRAVSAKGCDERYQKSRAGRWSKQWLGEYDWIEQLFIIKSQKCDMRMEWLNPRTKGGASIVVSSPNVHGLTRVAARRHRSITRLRLRRVIMATYGATFKTADSRQLEPSRFALNKPLRLPMKFIPSLGVTIERPRGTFLPRTEIANLGIGTTRA